MDTSTNRAVNGSLQISIDAIEKIIRHATLEVDGVLALKPPAFSSRPLRDRVVPPKPIVVNIDGGIADIQVAVEVKYRTSVPDLSAAIQKNIKSSIQNMTSITVGRVDVIVTGVVQQEATS